MKMTAVILLAATLHVSATGVAQKVTLNYKNVPVRKIFKEILRQTGTSIIYKETLVEGISKISINVKKVTVADVLNICFKDLPYGFKVVDNTIVIYRVAPATSLGAEEINPDPPPPVRITGTVFSDENTVLSGAYVTIKNTSSGTTTNAEGKFTLESPESSGVLTISYVGFMSKEIKFSGAADLRIILTRAENKQDEVVVIGYGTKTRGALTGSIVTTDSTTFQKKPLTNALNALQGAMPGVTILRGTGRPGGEEYSLQVRGYSSVNGNIPLILIDGVAGDLNTINPADIDNVTVLRDAAASIYGARAADGVVLVTTKKGKKGKPSIAYSINYGIKEPHFLKKMVNTAQLAQMFDEGMRNVGQPGLSQDVFDKIKNNAPPEPGKGWMKYLETYPAFYQSYDWNNIVYKNSVQQQHNMSVTGGGENNDYFISAGFNDNNGIVRYGTNDAKRYNFRINYSVKLNDNISLETRTSYDNQVTKEPSQLQTDLRQLPREWSYLPLYNPSGQFYSYQGYGNPAQYLQEGGARELINSRWSGNAKADIKIVKGLKLVAQAAITIDNVNDNANYRTFTGWNWDGGVETIRNTPNSAYDSNSRHVYQVYNGYLDYNLQLSDHGINLMAGTSYEKNYNEGQTTWGYNFRSNDIFTLNLADRTKSEYANFTGNIGDWALLSYFGRASYNYQGKYLLESTLRTDGSSKFAPNKRWSAVFPAISAGWIISKERFLEPLRWINFLKLRASWRKTGNQDLSFGNYDYIPLVSISGAYPFGSPNAGFPRATSSIASTDRTWETIETKNLGLNIEVLKSRLSASLDVFQKQNNNMLVGVNVPATLGGSPPTQNLGNLVTKGWEVSLGWKGNIRDLKYAITAFVSDNRNKLVDLRGTNSFGEGLNNTTKGYSMFSYFGYVYNGIIKEQATLDNYKKLGGVPANIGIGDAMYKDVDGDGEISAFGNPAKGSKGDLVYLGNLLPRYTYSGNINLSYKGFELGIFIQGVGQRSVIRYGDFNKPFNWVWFQPLQYFSGKNYSAGNPNAKYPRIVPGGIGFDGIRDWNWRTSNNLINNAAYLRLKVLTLGYTLPAAVCQKIKTRFIRVYFSGQDLLTFSKGTWNKSFDPEEGWSRDDEATYPFNKVYSVGVDVRF